jgi:hypothetical protein
MTFSLSDNPQNYPQNDLSRRLHALTCAPQSAGYHLHQITRVWFCQMRGIAKIGLAWVLGRY